MCIYPKVGVLVTGHSAILKDLLYYLFVNLISSRRSSQQATRTRREQTFECLILPNIFRLFTCVFLPLNCFTFCQLGRGILSCCSYECRQYRLVGSWTGFQSRFCISHWFAAHEGFIEHKCRWLSSWIITTIVQTMGKG